MRTDIKFILVDDDDITNFLHDMVLKDTLGDELNIETFTKAEEGLEYIQNNLSERSHQTILFLDINMPKINGWEFLERYEKFSDEIKQHIHIYILSSSLDRRDKNKADDNKNVKGFFSKPLTTETVLSITEKQFSLSK